MSAQKPNTLSLSYSNPHKFFDSECKCTVRIDVDTVCGIFVAKKSSSRHRHLQNKHKMVVKGDPKGGPAKPPKIPVPKELTLSLPTTPNEALLEFICCNKLPLNVVNDISFKNLIQVIQKHQDWKFPTRSTLAGPLLDQGYAKCIEQCESIIKRCEKVSITTYIWHAQKEQSYLSLTIHGIDSKNSLLYSGVLTCMTIHKSFTSKNIATLLRPTLEKIGLTEDRMTAWVTHEVGAVPSIAYYFDCPTVHCSRYLLLTLLIQSIKGIGAQFPELALIIDICKSISKMFTENYGTHQQVASFQRQHGLTQASYSSVGSHNFETRLSSILASLKCVRDNEVPLLNWLVNPELDTSKNRYAFLLHANSKIYWTIVNEILQIVAILETALSKLSIDNLPTIHLLIPAVIGIKKELTLLKGQLTQESCKALADALLKDLDSKFLPWNKIALMACSLSPCIVHSPDIPSPLIQSGLKHVNKELLELFITDGVENGLDNSSGESQNSSLQRESLNSSFNNSVESTKDNIQLPTNDTNSSTLDSHESDSLHTELQSYLEISKTTDVQNQPILEFWRSHRVLFPHLSRLAFRLLAVPATQIISEKQLSLMRQIFSKYRVDTDPETSNKILVHAAYVRRRNLTFLEQNRIPRSLLTNPQKGETKRQSGTSQESSIPRPSQGEVEAEFLLSPDEAEIVPKLNDDDRSTDEDEEVYFTDDSDLDEEKVYIENPELEPEDFDHTPPAKRFKLGENTTPSLSGLHYCELDICTTNKELIFGYIDNGDLWKYGLTFEKIFGPHFIYFTDFKQIALECSNRSFICKFSAEGIKKYNNRRLNNLFKGGQILPFSL